MHTNPIVQLFRGHYTTNRAGRITREATSFEAVSVRVNFDYLKDTTFYTRWGDWFVAMCAAAAAGSCRAGVRARLS
jgi:hypothetical protein